VGEVEVMMKIVEKEKIEKVHFDLKTKIHAIYNEIWIEKNYSKNHIFK
jgi:hypothetical protein